MILAKRDQLAAAELASTSPGDARKTMLMLAWGVALADADLALTEVARIEAMAQDMRVPGAVLMKLRSHAAQFLVERAVARAYGGGELDSAAHGEALALGRTFELSDAVLEQIDREARARAELP